MKRIYRKKREKIIIFTSTEDFTGIFRYLAEEGNSCSVAIPENRVGSRKIANIKKFCNENAIEVMIHPQKEEELAQFNQMLVEKNFSFAISWSYSQILKKSTLDIFPNGVWNMHGGKVPEYRGANVLQWAIINGEKEVGITWHIMDEKIDHGLVLKEGKVVVGDSDIATEIKERQAKEGLRLFKELWQEADGKGVLPYKINMDAGKYWKARKPLDGIINKAMTEKEIKNLLRAQCPPYPAPFVVHNNKVYRVHGFEESKGRDTIEYFGKNCVIFLRVTLEENIEIIKKILEGD